MPYTITKEALPNRVKVIDPSGEESYFPMNVLAARSFTNNQGMELLKIYWGNSIVFVIEDPATDLTTPANTSAKDAANKCQLLFNS